MEIYTKRSFLEKSFRKLIPEEIREHSLLVAQRCREEARKRGLAIYPLFYAGLFHDIGKSKTLLQSGFHPLDGARYLDSIGEKDIAYLVARHSTSPQEASLLKISLNPWHKDKFPEEQTILDLNDLTTSREGKVITFRERCDDIIRRYGEHSIEARALRAPEIKKKIKNAGLE